MSKAAVEMLTQCTTIELGEHGISSVAICPGPIKGKMLIDAYTDRAKVEGITTEEYFDKMSASIPGRRYADPVDIANTAAFLAEDKAYHINGTHVIVAGGLIIR
jgi:NAD(P)-dependent dehydrogenase (short-subunit alcohol dehydrogenase family)